MSTCRSCHPSRGPWPHDAQQRPWTPRRVWPAPPPTAETAAATKLPRLIPFPAFTSERVERGSALAAHCVDVARPVSPPPCRAAQAMSWPARASRLRQARCWSTARRQSDYAWPRGSLFRFLIRGANFRTPMTSGNACYTTPSATARLFGFAEGGCHQLVGS